MPRPLYAMLVLLAVVSVVACGDRQAKPSLNVIEVQQRTSMMSGFYLEPFDDGARNSGRVISPADAVAAAKKSFSDFEVSALGSPNDLRLYLGIFAVPETLSPSSNDHPSKGHAYYVITSDTGIRCMPATGGGIPGGPGTPTVLPTPPESCRWEIQVDAVTGEAQGLTSSALCPQFPEPRTCR